MVTTTRYLSRPAHLFGGVGLLIGLFGIALLSYLSVIWFIGGGPIGNRPLFFLGILAVLMGAQLTSFGLLAELFVRRIGEEDPLQLVREEIASGGPSQEAETVIQASAEKG